MFNNLSESVARRIRLGLAIAWLILIASLFYDPVSAWLTSPSLTFSPFQLSPSTCVPMQGECIKEAPYAIGASVFWGMVVPASVFILLVFGHELWRRICPLSFFSQLPRAFNSQRRIRKESKNGKVRYEVPKVAPNSWLANNYLYLQMGLFYLGLCIRILFTDSSRISLAIFLLGTIGVAVAVGYFYGGKSWCNYFCPMAPVQRIYSEPGGLLTSKAHLDSSSITQSMCRTTDEQGQDVSACVACQTPCIDIDSERSYWENIAAPDRKTLYYGYFGLMVGYFSYYYLYSGNWLYYLSGAWSHQKNQLATLLDPGLYLFHTVIPIPRLLAVPLVLGLFAALSIAIGPKIEALYKTLSDRIRPLEQDIRQHHIFCLYTYCCFNIFFIFGGRGFVNRMPHTAEYVFDAFIVALSTLWLTQTIGRTPHRYARERVANRLRKQLVKLGFDGSSFARNQPLEKLNVDEVYVLAKVLPEFSQDKKLEAYKGIVEELVAEDLPEANRQEMLAIMQRQLDISDQEHKRTLAEAQLNYLQGDEFVSAGPKNNAAMSAIRYRQTLARIRKGQQQTGSDDAQNEIHLPDEPESAQQLHGNSSNWNAKIAGILLHQLYILSERSRVLSHPIFESQSQAASLLKDIFERKQRLVLSEIFSRMQTNRDVYARVAPVARAYAGLAPEALRYVLDRQRSSLNQQLPAQLVADLEQFALATNSNDRIYTEPPISEVFKHLRSLCKDSCPLIQSVGLFLLSNVDIGSCRDTARQLRKRGNLHRILAETVDSLLQEGNAALDRPSPGTFHAVEKLVTLGNSTFFTGIGNETLIELSCRGQFFTYNSGEKIIGTDDNQRELLILAEGSALIEVRNESGTTEHRSWVTGEAIDKLEIVGASTQPGQITAKNDGTRILAVPVNIFDEFMDEDRVFAQRVLKMESHRLNQFLEAITI